MTVSPLVPHAIVRASALTPIGAVTPPSQRVRVSPPPADFRPRAVTLDRSKTKRRAAGLALAVAALLGAIAWADAPDARGAAPRPTEGTGLALPVPAAPPAPAPAMTSEAPARRILPPGNATEWLKVGWMKANPYPVAAPSERKRLRTARKYRAARVGTLRKVDDPKPNPYY